MLKLIPRKRNAETNSFATASNIVYNQFRHNRCKRSKYAVVYLSLFTSFYQSATYFVSDRKKDKQIHSILQSITLKDLINYSERF